MRKFTLLLLPLLACAAVQAQESFQGDHAGEARANNGLKLPLRWCPPGEFVMGSPADEPGRDHDETPHRVRLTHGYWLGETEVTQGQWKAVTGRSLRDQAGRMLADPTLYRIGGRDIPLNNRTHGACTKCSAISTNGSRISRPTIRRTR